MVPQSHKTRPHSPESALRRTIWCIWEWTGQILAGSPEVGITIKDRVWATVKFVPPEQVAQPIQTALAGEPDTAAEMARSLQGGP